jgi:hypothetical protein
MAELVLADLDLVFDDLQAVAAVVLRRYGIRVRRPSLRRTIRPAQDGRRERRKRALRARRTFQSELTTSTDIQVVGARSCCEFAVAAQPVLGALPRMTAPLSCRPVPSDITPAAAEASPPAVRTGERPTRQRLPVVAWLTGSSTVGLAGWALVVAAIAGIALRVWVLRSPLGDADSDEAVTGLMAMHALHGHFRALYWGANYAGTLEVLLTAGVFGLVGASTIALKAVPIGLSFIGAILVWRVGREYLDEQAGRLAAILFWIFPGGTVLLLMKAQVVYASGTCLILIALLLARRLRDRPDAAQLFLLGLVGGLCLWATPLLLTVYLPIAATVGLRTWRKPRVAAFAVPGAVLGALPWLWFSLHNDWVTLVAEPQPVVTTYRTRLAGGLFKLYPLLLGLRKPLTEEWIVSPLFGATLYAVILVGGVTLCAVRYRARVLPLLAPVVLFPFLYAVLTTSWYWTEPRHGTLVSPLLLVVAASLVPRRFPIQALVALLALLLTIHVIKLERNYGELSGSPTIVPGKLRPVIDAMQARNLDTCYADYWIAYRITFESGEDIICAPLEEDRYPQYTQFANDHGARTYLVLPQTGAVAHFRQRFEQLHITYHESTIDNVTMFVLDEAKRPDQVG